MLFPLPFTPFEYYYWCDNRPEYPTTFWVELTFEGELNRERFVEALAAALDRHPLLTARVDTNAGRIPCWIAADRPYAEVDWGEITEPVETGSNPCIDLTQTTGLRVWGRSSYDRSRVVFQFHHACCDAIGAFRFVEDLLVAYAGLTEERDDRSDFRPLDVDRLRLRGDFGLTEQNYRPNLKDTWATFRFWMRQLVRQPTLLAPAKDAEKEERASGSGPDYETHVLDAGVLAQLRAVANREDVTLNDLMLRDLFVTVADWNRRQGHRRKQRLRANVPVSLRLRADRQMPAANVLGFWFVARGEREIADRGKLLRSIREEMLAVNKWRLPLFFIGGLGFAMQMPGLMPWSMHRNRTFATLVFSNTGRVLAHAPLERRDHKLVCGDVVLEQITGVPPLRPGTRAAMAVIPYGAEATINLACDPAWFSNGATRQLLDAYVRQLRETGEQGA